MNGIFSECPFTEFYKSYLQALFTPLLRPEKLSSHSFWMITSIYRGLAFSSYKIELWNRVTQSDVTLRFSISKTFHFELLIQRLIFCFSSFWVTNSKLKNKTFPLSIRVWMSVQGFWGSRYITKSRNEIDLVSEKWESINTLYGCCIPIGFRGIQFQSFDHVNSSYVKWWTCGQILVVLAVRTDTAPWTFEHT